MARRGRPGRRRAAGRPAPGRRRPGPHGSRSWPTCWTTRCATPPRAEPVRGRGRPARDGRWSSWSVADHGPGVPAGRARAVFQMFNRASGGGRAGLGLTIAKAFVEAHGQTHPGGGRRPAAGPGSCSPCPGRSRRPWPQCRARAGSVARILLVDDDRLPAAGPAHRPVARGYEVVVARTGAEGVTQASLTTPDVVVLDLGLPDLDGVEVCRRIRQWSQVPIIVLSAAGSEDRKVAALDGGADDYVTKPFGMAELEARLRVALRRVDRPARPGRAHRDHGWAHRGRPGAPHGPTRRPAASTSPGASSTCWPTWPATPARSAPTR